MSKRIEFFFDVGSPTSYLAWTQLPLLCSREDAKLVYRPILLGGVFRETGNASPAAVPAKGRYVARDIDRYARRYDVPFAHNPYFPINTLHLMRALVGVQLRRPDRFDAFLEETFRAIWVDRLNMGDPEIAAGAFVKAGVMPNELLVLVNDSEVKDALKANTDEAVRRGVFGVPTMFVGMEMFFGQDRLDFVSDALRAE
ncbi:2-hydroxychromene-2-carboxylate isomerase [Paraburkholderia sp. RP-4-7]|uniref:2-hydroxychromene-2-carboxylate isomerase n=1 Tax=Paraburkholderia polaris TaxID=2728848 RepID=A0A848IST1_9BURK|nr:2-hydroxychromene-2-carboxylate isomerase [Paraburkholderia polaris]NMM04270.1 2-hydroxychromene-2-carboxylate isomerase [Paraburkholderia polaris]